MFMVTNSIVNHPQHSSGKLTVTAVLDSLWESDAVALGTSVEELVPR